MIALLTVKGSLMLAGNKNNQLSSSHRERELMAITTGSVRIAAWTTALTVLTAISGLPGTANAQTVELRYGHMNPPTSAAGLQAQMLADAIAKNTSGQVTVKVYPSSQLGKLQELAYEGGAGSYTRDGNLVGHIALGLMMVREAANGIAGFPIELRSQIEHLVASHHGTREYGSPVEPKTIEAFILATVDELDTKLNQVRRAINEDPSDDEFTAWNKRLGRVLYKGNA